MQRRPWIPLLVESGSMTFSERFSPAYVSANENDHLKLKGVPL